MVTTPMRTYPETGAVKPWVKSAAILVGNQFNVSTIGGIGGRSYASDHPLGFALDFMVGSDKAKGDAVATYLIANASRLGITYIIWYRRIWQGGTWKPYNSTPDGNTSNTALHMDHVHASFTHTAPTGGTQGFGTGVISSPITGLGDQIPGVKEAKQLYSVAQQFTKAAAWLADPGNWLRIAMFVGGLVLLIFGIFRFNNVRSATKTVADTASKVVQNA